MDICKLKNGITVVSDEIEYVNSLTIGVFIKGGASIETKDSNGLYHLTEHIICKDFVSYANDKGFQSNGITTKEYMCFFVKSVYSDMRSMVESLSLIFNPSFSVDEFELIKNVVKREIVSYVNNDNNIMEEILFAEHTQHHPYSLPINGSCTTVDKFTLEDVVRLYEETFVGENIVISIAGKKAGECKKFLLEQRIGASIVNKASPFIKTDVLISHDIKSRVVRYQTKNTKVKICINGLSRLDKEKYVLQILCAILGGTSKSIMNSIFRIEQGLSYLAYCVPIFFQYGGLLYLNIDTEEKNIERVLKNIYSIFQSLCSEKINRDYIALAKKYCLNENIIKHETSSAIMTKNGLNVLFDTIIQADEEINYIYSITEDDLYLMSKRIFNQGKTILIGSTLEEDGLLKYSCSSCFL